MGFCTTQSSSMVLWIKIDKVYKKELVIIQSEVKHCTVSFEVWLFSYENKIGEMH